MSADRRDLRRQLLDRVVETGGGMAMEVYNLSQHQAARNRSMPTRAVAARGAADAMLSIARSRWQVVANTSQENRFSEALRRRQEV